MKTISDECVDCPPEIGCIGSACPYRNVVRFYCDRCKEEIEGDYLYLVDGEDLCEDCLKRFFRVRMEDL